MFTGSASGSPRPHRSGPATGASEASWRPCGGTSLSFADPSDPDRQLAFDGLGQQASHAARVLDVQAEQGGVAEQDRAGFGIEPKLHPLELGAQFVG